jgi:hypothetical protein
VKGQLGESQPYKFIKQRNMLDINEFRRLLVMGWKGGF